MEPVNLIRVFIASPGDVGAERIAVVDACSRANIELGDYLKIRLEAIRWETHTFPAYGLSTQQAIFGQIDFARLDLFVGILADRFGTPTEGFGSGTEAEFERAVELHNEQKRPHIMLYFGDKAVPDTQDGAEQRASVLRFRDKLDRALINDTNTIASEDEVQIKSSRTCSGHIYRCGSRMLRLHLRVQQMCQKNSRSFT